MGKPKRGKGPKGLVLVEGQGPPLGASLDAASPADVRLWEKTRDPVAVGKGEKPERPRKRLKRRGLAPSSPAR